MDQEVEHVRKIDQGSRTICVVDDVCFEAPPGYAKLGALDRTQFSIEEEDDLLQFAIQQSLLEAGSEKDEVVFIIPIDSIISCQFLLLNSIIYIHRWTFGRRSRRKSHRGQKLLI